MADALSPSLPNWMLSFVQSKKELSALGPKITFVDTEDGVAQAFKSIFGPENPCKLVAIDCEGCNLGQEGGTLDLISIATAGAHANAKLPVFIFDATDRKLHAMIAGQLDRLMREASIVKLFYDVRADAQALRTELGLQNTDKWLQVVDVQVLACFQLLTRKDAQDHGRPWRPGMAGMLEEMAPLAQLFGGTKSLRDHAVAKDKVSKLFRVSPDTIWKKRPLTPTLLEYAAGDVFLLPVLAVYVGCKISIGCTGDCASVAGRLVLDESLRQVQAFAGAAPAGPIEIPNFAGLPSLSSWETLKCSYCERSLHRVFFSKTQQQGRAIKKALRCRACTNVDVEESRSRYRGYRDHFYDDEDYYYPDDDAGEADWFY